MIKDNSQLQMADDTVDILESSEFDSQPDFDEFPEFRGKLSSDQLGSEVNVNNQFRASSAAETSGEDDFFDASSKPHENTYRKNQHGLMDQEDLEIFLGHSHELHGNLGYSYTQPSSRAFTSAEMQHTRAITTHPTIRSNPESPTFLDALLEDNDSKGKARQTSSTPVKVRSNSVASQPSSHRPLSSFNRPLVPSPLSRHVTPDTHDRTQVNTHAQPATASRYSQNDLEGAQYMLPSQSGYGTYGVDASHNQSYAYNSPSQFQTGPYQYIGDALLQYPAFGHASMPAYQMATDFGNVHGGRRSEQPLYSTPAPRFTSQDVAQLQMAPAPAPLSAFGQYCDFEEWYSGLEKAEIVLQFKTADAAKGANPADPWIRGPDVTLPKCAKTDRSLVLRLIMAMNDMADATDNPKACDMWGRLQADTRAVELAAWQILDKCKVAHDQRNPLVASSKPPRQYDNFHDRIVDVCASLREQKTMCKHLIAPNYIDQMIDDPVGAANRIVNNRKVNGGKKVAITIGKRAMERARNQVTETTTLPAQSAPGTILDQDEANLRASIANDNVSSGTATTSTHGRKPAAKKRDLSEDPDFKPSTSNTKRSRASRSKYVTHEIDGVHHIVDTTEQSSTNLQPSSSYVQQQVYSTPPLEPGFGNRAPEPWDSSSLNDSISTLSGPWTQEEQPPRHTSSGYGNTDESEDTIEDDYNVEQYSHQNPPKSRRSRRSTAKSRTS